MGPGRSAALLMVLALAAPESTRALAVPDSLALHPAAAESLISFADHLRRSGEPYAAVTECKRALFLLPHGASPSRAYRCMALAHSELGDSREAISSARRSVATATELSERLQRRLDLAAVLVAGGYPGTAAVELLPLRSSDDPGVRREALLMLAIVHLYQGQWDDARDALHSCAACSTASGEPGLEETAVSRADSLLRTAGASHQRSELRAAILSALVPGLGQLCSGHPVEGVHAAALNGAIGYWTYCVAADRTVLESAVGPFPWFVRYYLGNIHWARTRTRARSEAERRLVVSRVLGVLLDSER